MYSFEVSTNAKFQERRWLVANNKTIKITWLNITVKITVK